MTEQGRGPSVKPAERIFDLVKWEPVMVPVTPDGLYATHTGTLTLGEITLRCYTLNDGQRVIDVDDIAQFFGGDRAP